MKRTFSFVGCGLLVVALGAVGCSKDKTTPTDAGVDSGTTTSTGGSSAGGKSGSGAAGKSGAGGAGAITEAQCVTMTNTNSGNMTPAMCVSCLCKADAAKTAACDGACWALASCVGSKCGGDAQSAGCISDADKCASVVAAGATKAMATPFAMCTKECAVPQTGGTDAGKSDAGN